MPRSLDSVIARYLGYALVFGGSVYLLYLVRGVLPLFFVAFLLAYAMEPILRRLERRGHSRGGAILFVFLVFLLLFTVTIALLASAWQQVQALEANFPKMQVKLLEIANYWQQRLEDTQRLPMGVKQSLVQAIEDAQKEAPGFVTKRLQGLVSWTVSSLGLLGILIVVLPIITLWFMMEMNALRARLLMLVPPIYRRDVTEIANKINDLLGRYVRGQMIVCGLFGLLCTIAFHVLSLVYGMQYPLVLGLLAAFFYIVPYVGMATIASAAALTAYATSDQPVTCAVIAVVCCFVFNLTIDYGISPRVLGRGVGLHPLMVIFALLSGAQVGGVLGMILAVPVVASLRVVAIHLFPQLVAPIPHTPPESHETRDRDATSEVGRQTREAEAAAVAPVEAGPAPAVTTAALATPAAQDVAVGRS